METIGITNELQSRIQQALETVRPFLIADGGDVELAEITSENIVRLRLIGTCSNCDMSQMTMKAGLEDAIRKAVPEIKGVVAV